MKNMPFGGKDPERLFGTEDKNSPMTFV